MWSNQGTRWHLSGGLVSCGDAAGLVDPLTGEGIAPAMESGIAAANAIDAYLASRDDHQLAAYSRWVLSTYQSRYAATPVRRMWQYLNFASQTSLTHAMN
jgi:flavin-dependent dehydrogenase